MARTPRPTHCAKCRTKLKPEEIPPADERGPETWCFGCCEAADERGDHNGLSTYGVAVLGYQGNYLE